MDIITLGIVLISLAGAIIPIIVIIQLAAILSTLKKILRRLPPGPPRP